MRLWHIPRARCHLSCPAKPTLLLGAKTNEILYLRLACFQLQDALEDGDSQKRADLRTLRGADPRVALLTEMTCSVDWSVHPLKRKHVYIVLTQPASTDDVCK